MTTRTVELNDSSGTNAWASKFDPSDHRACGLSSALGLIAGKVVPCPRAAFPVECISKFARAVQAGNSLWGLLKTVGRDRVVLTGESIAWHCGEVEYSTDPVLKQLRRFSKSKQPLFVVAGVAPAKSIAAFMGCDAEPVPRLYISKVNCSLVLMANWNGVPAVFHYGCCSRAISDIGRQGAGLGVAASDAAIAPLLPKLLAHKTLAHGAELLVESRIPADACEFSWRRIDIANEFWLSRKPSSNGETADELGQRLELVCSYSACYRELLLPLADALLEWFAAVRIPAGVSHGDFTLGNVLFDGETLKGVIDWDHARKDGIPLVDALFMIINSYRGNQGFGVGKLFRELWTDEFEDSAFAERIAWVGAKSKMDRDGLKFLGLMLWFDFLLDRANERAWQPEPWVGDMIRESVPVAMKWLDRHAKQGAGSATLKS